MKTNGKWYERLWGNFVVRNVALAVGILVAAVLVAMLLLGIFTRHNRYQAVPDFGGVVIDEARVMAERENLHIVINDSLYVGAYPPGAILEQRPAAGAQVKSGRKIFVTINSFGQKMVDVPFVAGYSLRQARNILETAGLKVGKLVYVNDIATNNVLSQSVGGKKVTAQGRLRAPAGSGVTLTVGRAPGEERAAVPRLAGLTAREAEGRIIDAGFNVGSVKYDGEMDEREQRQALVWSQSPSAGANAGLGAQVSLSLSLDSTTVASGVRRADNSLREAEQRAQEAEEDGGNIAADSASPSHEASASEAATEAGSSSVEEPTARTYEEIMNDTGEDEFFD